ncbi:V-set and transmembrane domain-containing protein 2A-like [Sinocyclocheilus grahami]|uniref:V-set and transmembrane domain-containing protein 2A-like n=1 Tax=Sinocyclocheilus grahami TaxID=75366 RepID=UPI0007ACA316|nr:PREDICTED: V-set and transmembrane domain-containing protein 2A-like [Sinocyclocheilus grahami]
MEQTLPVVSLCQVNLSKRGVTLLSKRGGSVSARLAFSTEKTKRQLKAEKQRLEKESLLPIKVQGNDISHKLQISRVSKNDEGLYECRVTDANYGELKEYKAQAYLKVNATIRPRNRAIKKSSPLHLTDKKPRKSSSALGQDSDSMSSDQRSQSTSTSQTAHSKTVEHSTGSGTRRCPLISVSNHQSLRFNMLADCIKKPLQCIRFHY